MKENIVWFSFILGGLFLPWLLFYFVQMDQVRGQEVMRKLNWAPSRKLVLFKGLGLSKSGMRSNEY